MFNEDTRWLGDLSLRSFPLGQTLTTKLLNQIREYLCRWFDFSHKKRSLSAHVISRSVIIVTTVESL